MQQLIARAYTLFVCCSRALERKSLLISGPTNLVHVAHVGPDEGKKALIELPVVRLLSQDVACCVKSFIVL